jgi:hypothetical protein
MSKPIETLLFQAADKNHARIELSIKAGNALKYPISVDVYIVRKGEQASWPGLYARDVQLPDNKPVLVASEMTLEPGTKVVAFSDQPVLPEVKGQG